MNSVSRQSTRGEHVTREGHRFDMVKADNVIGVRRGGQVVRAQGDGFVVFRSPRGEVGQEWFYFAQRRG